MICGDWHFKWLKRTFFLIVLIEKNKSLGINGTMDSFRAMLKYRCFSLILHQWQGQGVSTRNG
jgi:hypothetical protein